MQKQCKINVETLSIMSGWQEPQLWMENVVL